VFPGLPYIALHGFSHLLLTALALECGYPASSIRERIYAIPSVGYGVLLYTGSSDTEGTLGGLIQVGRRIHNSVRSCAGTRATVLERSGVRATRPGEPGKSIATCTERLVTACVLTAETSCEQQNDFLDRALVVKTVEELGAECSATLDGDKRPACALGVGPRRFEGGSENWAPACAFSADVDREDCPACRVRRRFSSASGMAASGTNREGLVAALELLAAARAQQPSIDEVIELVTTGPEAGMVTKPDTQVVVQELFRNAGRSVLVGRL